MRNLIAAAAYAKARWEKLKKNPKKYAAHKISRREYYRRWVKNGGNKNQRINTRNSSFRLKTQVLSHYGKGGKLKCCWHGCAVTDIDMLTLDHINNDGKQHKERGYKGGIGGYGQLRLAGYPSGFQTLCANHQLKKEIVRNRNSRL
jgi:hypothetical protein